MLALLHALAYGWLEWLVEMVYAGDGQAGMLLIPIWLADPPVTVIAFIMTFYADRWGWVVWMIYHPAVEHVWGLFNLVFYFVLGTLWWFFLPRLFLTRRLGGVWKEGP